MLRQTDQIKTQCVPDQHPTTLLHSPAAAQHASGNTWVQPRQQSAKQSKAVLQQVMLLLNTLPATPAQQGAKPSRQFVTKLLKTVSATHQHITAARCCVKQSGLSYTPAEAQA
jgi:hypothetical protein